MASFFAVAGFLLLSPLGAVASPIGGSPSYEYAVKDRHPAPYGWSVVDIAPTDHVLDISIGLKQSRFDELERILYQVSDPLHSSYGQYLSDDQVHQLVQPTEETLASVENWLEDFGFDTSSFEYSPARDWIKFTADVGTVEELLNTTYFIYEHEDGSTLVRTEAWSLPANLHEHVTTIQPTNSFARLHGRSKPRREIQKRSTNYIKVDEGGLTDPSSTVAAPTSVPSIAADPAAVSGVCNFSSVTPLCLRTLYGTLSYTPKVPGKNKMGLTNYLGEYNNRSDASIFLEAYRPEMAAAAYQYTQVSIAGGDIDNGTNTADQAPDTGFEGNLDVQYMLGIGYPTPLTTYSTGGRNPTFMPDALTTTNSDEPYLVFANYITGQPKSAIPQVISTSYGDDEQTVSKSYAEAVCNQFAQLGAKGVSIMFASGDNGVGPTGLCVSNADNTTRKFLPSFPNDCPYVTNVGATTEFPETAAYDTFSDGSIFTSGAGFSEYFSQPKYQAKVVQDYVAGLGGLYEGLYNPSGRAYPDLSCNGQRYNVVWNGSAVHLDGTSASTPACSAIFALVNDALIAAGRPALGFMNPWLYGGGYKLFTDVTNGSSAGCNTQGFPATAGWDAVTGWGTPYFPRLLQGLGL